jgi:hypothetical protein
MIHKAKDLTPDQKLLIENLLGRRVLQEEAISVRAFEPPALSDERRQELVEKLKQYFLSLDANRKSGSSEAAEELITEAIRASRSGYRSHK